MEVAASIAGVLSLTAQCISGAQTLRGFYQDVKRTSKTVEAFMRDLNSLLRNLHDVQCLLEKIQEKSPYAFDDICMTSLKLQLEDCNSDVASWLAEAQLRQPSVHGARGTRAWFRDFWTAVNEGSVKNIRAELQKRRVDIAVALSTLGRAFDLQLASATASIEKGVQELADITPLSLQSLERIENLTLSISNSIGSMTSLQSTYSASSSSVVSSTGDPNAPRFERTSYSWDCNRYTRRETFFGPSQSGEQGDNFGQCRLCGLLFIEPPQWDVRMHHVEMTHNFGRCSQTRSISRLPFTSLIGFRQHLKKAHSASDAWTNSFEVAYEGFAQGSRIAAWLETTSSAQMLEHKGGASKDAGDEQLDSRGYPADVKSADEYSSQEVMLGSWDAQLLGEWSSKHDRINRWMLHILGASEDQARLHRKLCEASQVSNMSGRFWGRFVMKYWFLDEAAIGNGLGEITAASEPSVGVANVINNISASFEGNISSDPVKDRSLSDPLSDVSSLEDPSTSPIDSREVLSVDSYGFPMIEHPSCSQLADLGNMGTSSGGPQVLSANSQPFGRWNDSMSSNCFPPPPQSMMAQFSSKVSSSSQKKHACKTCNKRFTRPSSLQTHMYSHTGEKPFACDVEGCGRHFSVVSNLRRHRKVHSGEARDAP